MLKSNYYFLWSEDIERYTLVTNTKIGLSLPRDLLNPESKMNQTERNKL